MLTNFAKTPNADASLLKQINSARILGLLRCHPGLSRAEIARRTGLTRSTVTVITAELMAEELVCEGSQLASKPGGGRPGIKLHLNPEGAFFIGAAIEADHVKVLELNLAAQITNKFSCQLTQGTAPDIVIERLIHLIEKLRRANPLSLQRLRGIGLTIPGTINRDGLLIRVPGLNWHGINLRQHLEARFDLPFFIDNDANAAALAEVYLGSAIQSESLLYLLLNEGVGSGIVVNCSIMRGANGTAGEVCELIVDAQNSRGSDYGQPGSLGALVGKAGLLRQYREQGATTANLNDLVRALAQKNALARAMVHQWGQRLSRGLISILNVLNPEQVVIGGPLTILLPYVEEQLNQSLERQLPRNGEAGFFDTPNSRWKISEFGEDASAIGGAILVYQSLFQVPSLVF